MITQLTPEQEALLPVYRDKWLDIGLSTAPLNFDAAKAAAIDAYATAGLKAPRYWFRFQSPFSAAIGAAILKNQVKAQVKAQVRAQVWAQVGAQVSDQVSDQLYGCHDANWLAFYDFFSHLCKAGTAEKLGPLMRLAEHCGWWAPYDNICILQDRPSVIRFDDQNRTHCETGPAIAYRDGFAVHCWHGTRIPAKWLDKKTLSPQIALTHANLEQRRAACEILGWHRILGELNAVQIDRHSNPQIGELLEVDLPGIGREKFLRVVCGTGRTFALPVPPEMTTALEANAWTYGLAANDYQLEVRT